MFSKLLTVWKVEYYEIAYDMIHLYHIKIVILNGTNRFVNMDIIADILYHMTVML